MDATAAAGLREATLSSDSTLAEFAAEHALALTRFAYVLCGDHQLAEDLVQDAFLSLHRRFGATLPVAAPVAYARRTIANAAISRGRRRASGETVLAEPADTPAAAGGAGTETAASADTDAQDAMWRALSLLPERQRAVLVLRYYLDLPDREIANILGCREGTVRSLATRAFATLRTSALLTRTEEP